MPGLPLKPLLSSIIIVLTLNACSINRPKTVIVETPLTVEHQIFKGECSWCGDKHQAELPESVPDVQMGPNLHSFIAIQATQHHQSIGKIQSMLKDVFQLNFSTGAISAAQGRVTEYLADTHTQIHDTVKASKLIMADETSHQRNNDKRWMWAALSNNVAFFQIG
ncbi:IS66 family transposase [Shewanella xiamenensis]|uniref:IS66 family transposase n=1 Tax=Shewanella xiamenensis TaxID=332186 RepID=UPI001CFF79B9|nr:transposase [Shewanella xiamenensis]